MPKRNLQRPVNLLSPRSARKSPAESERRFALLVDSVTEYAILMLDAAGLITIWNSGAQRIYGYSKDEIVGRHFSLFYSAEVASSGKPALELETALKTGRFEEEGIRLRKDGSAFWANVVLTPVFDETRRLLGFTKVVRDVTERRRMQDALRESEERFRLLVQSVKDYAIFRLDPQGRVSSWNAGAERAKGYRADEILGRHFGVFYPPEEVASGRPDELLRIAAEQGRVEVEGWRIRKDGSRFWADVILTAIRDDAGRLLGFAKITRDMTQRKESDEKLRAKQEEVLRLQKMETVGRLAGGIAHDFNNLLAGILGCSEEIARELGQNPGAVVEANADIASACERGSQLVRQLLAFGRRQISSPKHINLNDVITNLMPLLQRSVGSRVNIRIDLDAELATIEADISQMEQILMNLAINARDAMPSGGTLTLRTRNANIDDYFPLDGFPRRPARAVQLTVADRGTGIPLEIQSKVFEPFFTTKPQGKGTGLGLSTVYGIVQQNAGAITLYSRPGMGSAFKIFLPAASLSEPGASELPKDSEEHSEETSSDLILVVDDDALVLKTTVRNLRNRGYTVLSTESVEEAIVLFEKVRGRIGLLITDVMMPGMNGKQLADRLRAESPSLRVLFMSGYEAETIAVHGVLSDEVDFIEKPFSGEAMAQRVKAALQRPA